MRLSERFEQLPVEEWAATVARVGRRVRRRASRRRGPLLGGGLALGVAVLVAGNALFQQTARHPAPLWGSGDGRMAVASHGAPNETAGDRETIERSPLVEKVQNALAEEGYFDGPPSGVLTEPTRDAIRTFEAAQGLEQTGKPSVALLAAVSSAVEVVSSREPVPDYSVADIQKRLNERGYGPLEVDGLMGPRTRDALADFARAQGLDPSAPRSPPVMRALARGNS